MLKLYSKSHEWAKIEGNVAEIGISDFAAKELGDVVYVELPEVGKSVNAGDELLELESVKAASPVFSPVSGTVTEVNSELEDEPEKLSSDAEAVWICKIELSAHPAGLMDEAAYRASL